jgi:hypothetical protein
MLTEAQQKALKRVSQIEKIAKDPHGQILELSDLENKHYEENTNEHKELSQELEGLSTRLEEVSQAIEDIELIEPQKGEKGDKGDKGDTGSNGLNGKDGVNGIDGKDGLDGLDGQNGAVGERGEKGDKPDHKWEGTKLAFEKPDGTFGEAVELRGNDGATYYGGGGGKSVRVSNDGVLFSEQVKTINFADGLKVSGDMDEVKIDYDGSEVPETDPVFTAWLDAKNPDNWDTAYGWGNHADEGYLKDIPEHGNEKHSSDFITLEEVPAETDPVWTSAEPNYLDLRGRTGGQVMQGMYILASILKNQEDSIATLYVATTGNDTTGDGTSDNPFATLERACDEINKFVNVFYSIIRIADGTYNNTFVNFPTTVRGIIQVVGNLSNPNAVILNGNGSDCPLNITGGQIVDFEGFYIDNVGGANTISIDGASLVMKGVGISDGYGIYANRAYIKLETSPAMGNMPFAINQPFSTAIYAVNSVVDMDVNMTVTNSYIGVAGVNNTIIRQGVTAPRSLAITSKGGDFEEGVQVFGGSTYYKFGVLTYNGTKTTGMTNVGITVGDRSLFFNVSGANLNLSNCVYGIRVDGASKLNGVNPTITTSNVTTTHYYDYSTIYAWTVTPTFFKDDSYGFDARYEQKGTNYTPKVFNQSSKPTTTNIPAGQMAIWTDTDDSKCYMCYNHGGTIKTVELT